MVEPDFIVNLTLAGSGKLANVVAGHYEQAHRAGCRAAENLLSTPVAHSYGTVVASAGGHPLDTDLRQAHKGMENACRALQPGGTLLYFAECPHGLGIKPIEDFLLRYDTAQQMEEALRREFVVGGHKAYWLRRLGSQYRVLLVTGAPKHLVERCGFQYFAPDDFASALRALPGGGMAVVPHAGSTLPIVED